MKIKDLAIVVKLDSGSVYQVALSKEQSDLIIRALGNFVYPIKVFENPIEGIDLELSFNVKKPYMTNEEAEQIFK